jgi:hypothetical protein
LFDIVAHEERLHRASLWAEKSQSLASSAPPALTKTIPNSDARSDVSPTGTIQPESLQVQDSNVPSTGIIQPESSPAHVPTVASPPNSVASLIPETTWNPDPPANQATFLFPQTIPNSGPALTKTIPNSDARSDVSPTGTIQPEFSPAHVLTVASPPNSVASLIPETTSNPNPPPNHASFLFPQTIPNSDQGFAPNLSQTLTPSLNSGFDGSAQQSLMDLMSEPLYSWPNQNQQGLVDRDLFDFSGMNRDTNFYLPDQARANRNIFLNNTPTNINTQYYPLAAPVANTNTLAHTNFSALNNTPTNINTQYHFIAAPVTNMNTPAHANSNNTPVSNTDTPAHANSSALNSNTLTDTTSSTNQNKGTTANKSRKRKSDDVDLVLPDGSRRIRKKKSRPDENVPVSTKRGKKK